MRSEKGRGEKSNADLFFNIDFGSPRSPPSRNASPSSPRKSKSPLPHKRKEEEERERDEEGKDSMFFFENYHKINEEYEGVKKRLEMELRIKGEMREQLATYEQKMKDMETQRSDTHRASVARATQLDAEVRTLMTQRAAYEEKIERLERQREELTSVIKSTPPVTPHSSSEPLSVSRQPTKPPPSSSSSSISLPTLFSTQTIPLPSLSLPPSSSNHQIFSPTSFPSKPPPVTSPRSDSDSLQGDDLMGDFTV